MPSKANYKIEDVEAALRVNAGIISGASRTLEQGYGHCTPQGLRGYIARHPELQEVLDDIREVNLDLAESQLLSMIRDKVPAGVIFYLKTIGKKRGYIERVEATGEDGGPVEVEITSVRERISSRLARYGATQDPGKDSGGFE